MKFFNPKFMLLLILIGSLALFLGYKTQQFLSPSSQTHEIVIEMEALPAPSETSKGSATGQSIYASHCAACHDSGATNAPRIGDKPAWTTRISKGTPLLLQHVIEGYNLMPPKGACLECSETDLKMAVEYMVKQSN